MEVSFAHKITFEDYKKVVIDTMYKNNKKRLFWNGLAITSGLLLLIFKQFNIFGLSDRYPDYTLYLLGSSLIASPLLFYYATIKNTKKYFNSSPNIYNEVKYVINEEGIWYQSQDGNSGTCLWKNVFDIKEDKDAIRIFQNEQSMYLFVKEKIEPEKLAVFQKLIHLRDGINHLN